MGHDAIKLELIEWLAKLENDSTIQFLKIIKDTDSREDWWDELTEDQKQGIQRGLKDIEEGRLVPHDEVRLKYGL
jgi:predicted transcriptional regulator